jgi:RimJ/RimL family protein N-acetyltransferase
MDNPLRAWRYPDVARLDGRFVTVERLDPARDAADLYQVSHEPPEYQSVFTFMSYGPFQSQSGMLAWLTRVAEGSDPLYFSVLDKARQQRVGMAALLNIVPAHGRVEIGSIWYSPLVQKTRVNTEVTYLFLKTLFREYHYRRVEWKCDNANLASKQAALRMGFTYEGLFRQHMLVKGKNRDTAWFAIVDGDWPALEANFEAYLSGKAESLRKLNDHG